MLSAGLRPSVRALGLTGACTLQFKNYKIVYRRYAGLFFTVCVDVAVRGTRLQPRLPTSMWC